MIEKIFPNSDGTPPLPGRYAAEVTCVNFCVIQRLVNTRNNAATLRCFPYWLLEVMICEGEHEGQYAFGSICLDTFSYPRSDYSNFMRAIAIDRTRPPVDLYGDDDLAIGQQDLLHVPVGIEIDYMPERFGPIPWIRKYYRDDRIWVK